MKNNNKMNGRIYVLQASGGLVSVADSIQKVVQETKDVLEKLLPLPDLDILIEDNPYRIIEGLGVGGYAQSAHLVNIYIDPSFPDFENAIHRNLSRTIAHELHHSVRWLDPGYGKTLLEAMVSEGLADHFEIEFSGGEEAKYDLALTDAQIKQVGELAREEYFKNYNHSEWFFGVGDRGIPKWAGYTLGFNLVKNYLAKHPDKKPSQLYNVKAEEIIS